jgi:phosphohistidine phosphatase
VRRLTVLRHAKSSWINPSLPDNQRPLSSRGEKDASMMAARLAARGERPDLILTSHAQRAAATAKAVAAHLGCPDGTMRIERRLYLAPPDAILQLVRSQDDAHAHVLLVGHNPGLTELANHLLPAFALGTLPTAGVVAIEVAAPHWSALTPDTCRLLYYDHPKRSTAS